MCKNKHVSIVKNSLALGNGKPIIDFNLYQNDLIFHLKLKTFRCRDSEIYEIISDNFYVHCVYL